MAALLLTGCGAAPVEPVDSGPPVPQPPPLPAEALLALDELTPRISPPTSPVQTPLPPRAAEHLAEGEELLSKRDFVAAVDRLERAAAIAPDHPRVHRLLGIAYARLRNEGKALASLQQAAEGAPDSVETQVRMGRLQLARGAREEARKAFRTALLCSDASEDSPWRAEALWHLGELLAQDGYYTAALQCQMRLQEAIDQHARELAANRTLRPIVLNPERLMARRGDLLLRLRRPEEAAEALEQAYRRDRTQPSTATLWVEALLAAGQQEKAMALFNELAAEPAMSGAVPELARSICDAVGDPGLPRRLWEARKAGERVDGALAVALADAARRLGAEEDTMAILGSVLETMPGNAVVGRFLARLYAERGRFDDALRVLAGVLAANEAAVGQIVEGVESLAPRIAEPDFERRFASSVEAEDGAEPHALYFVAAELARQRGKTHLAADLLNRCVEAQESFLPAYEALADIYLAQGRLDRAERLVNRLRQADPDGALADFVSGKLDLIAGRSRQAAESLERARSREPQLQTLLLLAEAYAQLRQLGQAADVLKEAGEIAPNDLQISARLFNLYLRTRSVQAAEALLARVPSESFVAKTMAAELALLRNQALTAEKIVEELQEKYPEDPTVQRLAIQAKLTAGGTPPTPQQRDEAVRQLRELLSRDEGDRKIIGLLASLLGKSEEALEVLEQGHRARPGDVEIALAYASALENADRYGGAADVLRGILANSPDDPRLRLALGQTLLRAERFEEAAEQARMGLDQAIRPSTAASFRFLLLRAHTEAEDYDSAQALLDDWILATGDDRLRVQLQARKVYLFAEAGQMDRGEEWAMDWIRRSPRLLAAREALISALTQADRFDRAAELLESWAEEAGPPEPEAPAPQATQPAATAPAPELRNAELLRWCRRTRAQLLLMQGDYADALEQIDAILNAYGPEMETLSLKAACLNELGRPREGLKALEAAYELDPDQAGINNDLGYSYADQGVHLDKAERMVRRALAEQPDNIAFMDSLGWVFYKQGRFEEAGRKFDQILEQEALEEDGHPVIFDHAGDVYYRLGRMNDAREMWQRALEDAAEEKRITSEIRMIQQRTPQKLEALQADRPAPVAPTAGATTQPASGETFEPSGQIP